MDNTRGLWRGKRTDNGEWVTGYYAPAPDGKMTPSILTYTGYGAVEWNEINPDTLGECTGLTDKNGKMIFEGDIVNYTFDSPDDPTATENGLKVRVGRVFWSDWRASFAVTGGRNGSSVLNQDIARYVRGRALYEYIRGANTVEIIGNVHDNPELIGGSNG